jgi:hypothetical protein
LCYQDNRSKKTRNKGGKGWGYKDANATNKKTFVATLSMPYSISKHNTFTKKTLLESSRDKKGYKD